MRGWRWHLPCHTLFSLLFLTTVASRDNLESLTANGRVKRPSFTFQGAPTRRASPQLRDCCAQVKVRTRRCVPACTAVGLRVPRPWVNALPPRGLEADDLCVTKGGKLNGTRTE